MNHSKTIYAFLFLIFATFFATANAAPVQVSLPNITADTGSTFTVPVTTGDVTGLGVIAYDFEVRFDPAVLQPVQSGPTSSAGTMSNGFMITANPNLPGRLLVSGFSAFPLAGQGTLLNLNFRHIGAAGTGSPLTWASLMYNEGNPAVQSTNGAVNSALAPVIVSAATVSGSSGATVAIPVNVDSLNGRNILSYSFTVAFDPNIVRPAALPVTTANTLSSNFNVTPNVNNSGQLSVSASGSNSLAGAGQLLILNFDVIGAPGSTSAVNITSFAFNGGAVQSTTNNGRINVNVPAPQFRRAFDFDGDGKADFGVFRPSDGRWYRMQTSNGIDSTPFGLSTDRLAPADYDGDGKTDIAVFRSGIWYIYKSLTSSVAAFSFGAAGDIPVPADFDGDGKADPAVFRTGTWLMLNLEQNQVTSVQFGTTGDKPLTGDYDGDGKADPTVYRTGQWHILRSSLAYTVILFGVAVDKPISGDFDGDGKSDPAVYRKGYWHVLRSTAGYTVTPFGLATDTPVAADYDGDGKTDLAVFRNGVWYAFQSQNGLAINYFGLGSDKPVAAAFNQ